MRSHRRAPVTVVAHNRAFDGAGTQVFVCSTLSGTSEGLAPGTYDFDFSLDGTSQLSTAPAQHGIVIESNGNVRLTPLTFALDDTGAIALHIASGRTGGNCGTVAAGGAGITATTITLFHNSDLTCAPITLNIGAGAVNTMPSTYPIMCGTPTFAGCIDSDQAITATSVAADNYTIHVKGIQGTVAMPTVGPTCWKNDNSIVIPPLGGTLTSTLNLGFATATAGCM